MLPFFGTNYSHFAIYRISSKLSPNCVLLNKSSFVSIVVYIGLYRIWTRQGGWMSADEWNICLRLDSNPWSTDRLYTWQPVRGVCVHIPSLFYFSSFSRDSVKGVFKLRPIYTKTWMRFVDFGLHLLLSPSISKQHPSFLYISRTNQNKFKSITSVFRVYM